MACGSHHEMLHGVENNRLILFSQQLIWRRSRLRNRLPASTAVFQFIVFTHFDRHVGRPCFLGHHAYLTAASHRPEPTNRAAQRKQGKMKGLKIATQSIRRLRRRIAWVIRRSRKRSEARALIAPPAEAERDDSLALSIMSFNIRRGTARDGRNHWQFRRTLVEEVLRRYKPDVLGLQEALSFQMAEVCAMLPGYGKVGCGHLGGSRGLHNAIFYDADRFDLAESGTFWLSDTPDRPASKGWGNIMPRTCTWARLIIRKTGQPFYVYNIHLDHLSGRSRKRSVLYLTERIGSRPSAAPFVLTGDFNAGERSAPIRYLKGKAVPGANPPERIVNPDPLLDAFRVQNPNQRRPVTFHGFRRFFFRFRLDYIFVPPSIRVRDAEIIQLREKRRYPSDHFPLLTRLDLPADPAATPS
jgi:endonuclease/exonuclease/phosphatase family metal-dependent hydrolase